MRFDFAAARMAEVVEADWRAKAEVILQDRVRTGQGEVSESEKTRVVCLRTSCAMSLMLFS
jgi:hypothetical protein